MVHVIIADRIREIIAKVWYFLPVGIDPAHQPIHYRNCHECSNAWWPQCPSDCDCPSVKLLVVNYTNFAEDGGHQSIIKQKQKASGQLKPLLGPDLWWFFFWFSNPSTHPRHPQSSKGFVHFSIECSPQGQKLVLWNCGNLEGRKSSTAWIFWGEKQGRDCWCYKINSWTSERKHISMQSRSNEEETQKITKAATRLCY